MIYLKQIKLTNLMLVKGPVEELKYPHWATAINKYETTHSPLLMAYPEAEIYLIDEDGARLPPTKITK